MADTGKTIAVLGLGAVAVYVGYEYMQYSNLMNTYAQNSGADLATAESTLPFFTFIAMNWGMAGSSQQQTNIYNALVAIQNPATGGQTPGTTSSTSGQPTSVSTVPSSTRPPFHISMREPTIQRKAPIILPTFVAARVALGPAARGLPPAKLPIAPPGGTGMRPYMGTATGTGTKSTSTAGHGVHGFGAIEVVPGTVTDPIGNLIYQAHHPWPYLPSYTLKGIPGLGTITQATGMEKALLAGQNIRSRLIQ